MSQSAYRNWVTKNIGTAVRDAINKANRDALTGKKDKKITRQIRDKSKFVFDNTILDLSRAQLLGIDINTKERTNLPPSEIKLLYQNLRKLDNVIRTTPGVSYINMKDEPTKARTLRILFTGRSLGAKTSWQSSQAFIKLLLGQETVLQWQDPSLAKKNAPLDYSGLGLQQSGLIGKVDAGHIQGSVTQLAGAIPIHGIVKQETAKTIPEPLPVAEKINLVKNTLAYVAPNIADNFINKLLKDVNSSLSKAVKVSVTAEQDLKSGLIDSILLKQQVTIELKKRNLAGGQILRQQATEVLHTYRDIIDAHADDLVDAIEEEITKFLKSKDARLSTLQISSPTVMDNVKKSIIELWESSHGKTKRRKSKSTAAVKPGKTKAQGKYKSGKKTNVNKVQQLPVDVASFTEQAVGGLNLQNIMRIVNERLHDKIQQNMGKGKARRLNYRTGRFARSAELKELKPTRTGALDTAITYMRRPYDIFLDDGGKAPWKNGYRDPKKLIDKSIRQILREELRHEFRLNSRLV